MKNAKVFLLVVMGAAIVYAVTAFASGRTLEGSFCSTNTDPIFCMTLGWDGVDYGTSNRADLSLRPGTYWLNLNDDSNGHNFSLRSCPGSDAPCGPGQGELEDLTGIEDVGKVAVKLRLEHGTYRLLCVRGIHEARGMYVDFAVGGVGQVGS